MSTFNGRLHTPLLDFIAIDNFTKQNHDASVFFLSHFHTDHMDGLREFQELFNSNNGKILYCSNITERLLQHNNFSISEDQIVSLEVGDSTIIQSPQKGNNDKQPTLVTVTLIPTSHILGSVMFLFECENVCALYTGDFRFQKEDVSKITILHENGKPKKITDLYLDTTFADKSHVWFPPRDIAIKKVIDLSVEWLDASSTNRVAIKVITSYGYECLVMDLSKALNTKIMIDDKIFSHFKLIPEMDKYIISERECGAKTWLLNKRRKLPHSDRLGRIHVCRLSRYCTICEKYDQFRVIKPCAFSFHLKPEDSNICKDEGIFKVAFSTHCSLTELQYFVDYFSPVNIHPSVVSSFTSSTEIIDLLRQNSSKSTNHSNEQLVRVSPVTLDSNAQSDSEYDSDSEDNSGIEDFNSPQF